MDVIMLDPLEIYSEVCVNFACIYSFIYLFTSFIKLFICSLLIFIFMHIINFECIKKRSYLNN